MNKKVIGGIIGGVTVLGSAIAATCVAVKHKKNKDNNEPIMFDADEEN